VNVPTYPDLPYGKLTVEVRYRTDVAQFDTPYQVRSARWARSVRTLTIAYELLDEDWWQSILDLFERQQGGLSEFRFDDYVTPSPVGRQFGVGDGKTRVFHLPHDYTSGAVIYADEAPVGAVYVDSETGRVEFETAPARGVDLTYDANEVAFRARFADDAFSYERLHWGAYAATVRLEQVTDQQDIYPIRQVVCGGTITAETLDTIGDAVAFSFVCPCDVTVDDVSYYVPDYLDPGTVRASLYTDAGGAPGLILGYTDDVPGVLGWQSVNLVASVSLVAGTRYWLTVAAHVGTWDATHWCDVQYTSAVPNLIPGEDQDDMLWGGYVVFDRRCQNTPHSWLGVALKVGTGTWSLREPTSHPAFFLNQVPQIVGHCQGPLSQPVYDLTRTREVFLVETTHDMVIDRVGAVFSTVGAPADSLHYAFVFGSAPGVIQRTGILSAPVDTDGEPIYMEAALWTPLPIPTGETVMITFYSAGSVVGAPWTHWGHEDQWFDYALLWVPNWDSVRWAEDTPEAQVSYDGGATYPTAIRGAWTVRCRGVLTP